MPHTVKIRETVPLGLEETFTRLADHNRLGPILGIPVRRTRNGEGDVNGVGSVRTLGIWPIDFDETVVRFEPATRIEYRITRGSPLRNHYGTVAFSPNGTGTQIDWTIRFELALPVPVVGSVIKHGLGFGIARGLRGLARR